MCFSNGFDISISIIKNFKNIILKKYYTPHYQTNIKIELSRCVCNVREINDSCIIDCDQFLVRKS